MSVLTEKDYKVLNIILTYCDKVEKIVHRIGSDYNTFINDSIYQDSVSMNLLQIGEAVSKFSQEYLDTSKEEMDWRAIKGMRNLFAHAYDSMDLDKIWETAIDDIPDLKEYCKTMIQSQDFDEESETNEMLEDNSGISMCWGGNSSAS